MAGRVFFTSDLHLGHARVAGYRGFDSVEEHDAAVVDRWRSVVRDGDEVWVLGDVTANASNRALTHAFGIIRRLPGIKRLIWGNHDGGHPMYRDAHKLGPAYLVAYGGPFHTVASAARRRIGGREVLLSHFPYERDREEPRYVQWRLRDEGLPLLHGHTHGSERLTLTTDVRVERTRTVPPWTRRFVVAPPSRVEVHVGLDAWDLTPVPLETVAGLLEVARG